jgi:hypothetical protein
MELGRTHSYFCAEITIRVGEDGFSFIYLGCFKQMHPQSIRDTEPMGNVKQTT